MHNGRREGTLIHPIAHTLPVMQTRDERSLTCEEFKRATYRFDKDKYFLFLTCL